MRNALLLKAKKTFILSKPAFLLLLCAVILTGFLAVATVHHIDRGLRLMELSFLRQGTTMISAFEAGARTSMLFRQSVGHNPLVDLATEILRNTGIAYIRIIDDKGRVLVSEGAIPAAMMKTSTALANIGSDPISIINWDTGIFEVTKEFMPFPATAGGGSMMEMRWEQWHIEHHSPGKMFISVGFYTNDFETARKEDMRHTMFMAAMLVLLLAAGLYFLYLYRDLRLTHDTLLNTRLYADHVLESIPDSLITLDAGNRIASCNGTTAKLFGKEIEELEGRPIVEAWPECPAELLQDNDRPVERSAECRHVSGELVPLEAGSAWLLDHLGQRIGRVLVLRDIREIRKMEMQLERARRLAALGSMAAGIAHEVRNPLGTLRGFAQFFGAEAGASEACRKYAHFMVGEVDRLNQLVSELLQFGAPRELVCQRVDVDALFAKVSVLMAGDFATKKIAFSCSRDNAVVLYGDADQLIQVILNLLKNSIRATSEGGRIALECSMAGSECRISVRDTGKGMSEETQHKMFDPFFTDSKGGTGLGLAVCHQIVEQHHGRFEVTSKLGQGTTVVMVLPKEKDNGEKARKEA